jgi:hypothetical protein
VKEKTKREYQKPEFTRVKLVPEEAVLGGCKNVGQSGPGEPPLVNCGVGGAEACLLDGS